MSKRKDKKQAEALYANLLDMTSVSTPASGEEPPGSSISEQGLASSEALSSFLEMEAQNPRQLVKMKKFRFQLLHQWMIDHLEPCRVADIGGGKGLLAYLLQQSGWEATVIDPVSQALPNKYKDMATGKQIHIAPTGRVPRIDQAFEPEVAQSFELLVAMHAHGCTIKIIEAAAHFGRSFILLPCCIIDEPLYPPLGVHWLQCVIDYAMRQGFTVHPFRLNFKGQNISFYARPTNCASSSGAIGTRPFQKTQAQSWSNKPAAWG